MTNTTVDRYQGKEKYVHDTFNSIAHRYDLLNTILSLNCDKYWRRFAVKKACLQEGDSALDVCCGTGMLTIELAKKCGPAGRVVGCDFSENMLARAEKNIQNCHPGKTITLVSGNAMELPFAENSFDCATIGFGLRNVPDIKRALEEMQRVVKPHGRVISLELSKPEVPVFKQLYYFYFERLVPLMGKKGVGFEGPYRYLPMSLKGFPHQKKIYEIFQSIGLNNCRYYELTGGIVSVHVGIKMP